MIYLLALIPAIGWGAMPLITGKIGGSPVNKCLESVLELQLWELLHI